MATARKTSTAKKTPAKKTTAVAVAESAPKASPRTARASKPAAKIIRNLRNCPVHLRLFGPLSEKPYRIQLNPRGSSGDISSVPVNVQDTPQFIQGAGVLFEIITETEARAAAYGGNVFEPRVQATIISDESSTIATHRDVKQDASRERLDDLRRDSRGHTIPHNDRQQTGAGPAYADVPGSDEALHQGLREGARNAAPTADDMLPASATFDRRLVVERTKG